MITTGKLPLRLETVNKLARLSAWNSAVLTVARDANQQPVKPATTPLLGDRHVIQATDKTSMLFPQSTPATWP